MHTETLSHDMENFQHEDSGSKIIFGFGHGLPW